MALLRKITTVLGTGIFLTLQCSLLSNETSPGVTEGNGESIGTGMVAGMLYEPGGKAPAKGASVVVRYRNETPSFKPAGIAKTTSALYATLTDANGVFSFDTIADGLYVIEGSDALGNMVLFDSVQINAPPEPLELPPDTLEPSGTITGTITLPDGGNFLQVFVLAFGIDRFSQVRSDGRFTFAGLAAGVYTLKILSLDPVYQVVDTAGITVESGDTTDIGAIELPLTYDQPFPQGLEVRYDTILMRTTLSWYPTPPGVTKGYNVYRIAQNVAIDGGDIPSTARINGTQLVDDTAYNDSTIVWDYLEQQLEGTVAYAVTMVDTSGNESRRSAVAVVSTVNAWELYDSMSLTLPPSMKNFRESSIDRNDGFLLLGACEDGYQLARYSRDGILSGARQIPFMADVQYLSVDGGLIEGDIYDDAWFFVNFSYRSVEHRYDSMYIYHLLPSGEFESPLRITPLDTIAPRVGGIIAGGYYYYLEEQQIPRTDCATGTSAIFRDFSPQNKRVGTIVPGVRGGFAAMIHDVNQYEYIHFAPDGTELKKLILPDIRSKSGASENRSLVTVDDSTFYFDRFFYRLNAQGDYFRGVMPIHSTVHSLHVRSDGTIAIFGKYSTTVARLYRLRK